MPLNLVSPTCPALSLVLLAKGPLTRPDSYPLSLTAVSIAAAPEPAAPLAAAPLPAASVSAAGLTAASPAAAR